MEETKTIMTWNLEIVIGTGIGIVTGPGPVNRTGQEKSLYNFYVLFCDFFN